MLLNLIRKDNGLIPIDDASVEAVKSLRIGDEIHVDYKPRRNYKNHKRFFNMLQGVVRNSDHYKTVDNLLDIIKLKTGHFEIVVSHDGRQNYIPKSIAFHSMNEEEFKEFFSSAIDVVLEFTTEEDIESILQYC